jgi:hypothetical protein
MISETSQSQPEWEYPREDVCRHCGEHIGWIMAPWGEEFALGVCDEKECREKEMEKEDVGN